MNLLELFAVLTLDKSKYDEGLKDSENEAKGFGDKLKAGLGSATKVVAAGAAAAVAAGSAAVVKLTKDAVTAYANYEQLVGGVETLFGIGGQSLEEYAETTGQSIDQVREKWGDLHEAEWKVLSNSTEAYRTAGLSANEYMETVTSFSASLIQSLDGDTVKAAEVADRAIRDMSDNANKMGTDMSMIQSAYQGLAKQNYTMLDNLKLGYGGTKTEMERLISDAAKMKDVQKELNIEVKDGDLSFANIANAISVTQKKLGIMGTTEKEAASTIQGSIGMMKSAWQNLVTVLADDADTVDETLDWYVDAFVNSAETVAKNLIPRIENALNAIGKLIEKGVPIIIEKVPPIIMNLIPKVISAGANLAAAIGKGLIEGIPQLLAKIPEMFAAIQSSIQESLPEMNLSGSQIIMSIIQGIGGALYMFAEAVPNVLNTITGFIREGLPIVTEAGKDIITGIINGLKEATSYLAETIPMILESITGFISENLPLMAESGGEMLYSLATGFLDSLPLLIENVLTTITSVASFILDNLPTIVQAGIDMIGSLAKGILDGLPDLIANLPKIIGDIINFFISNLGKILETGIKIIVELGMGIIKGIPQLVAKLPEVGAAILKALSEIPGKVIEIGVNIVKGLWEGIKSMGQWIMDQVSGFFGGIVEGVKDFLGIKSPSKVFAELGRYTAEGFGEGFDDKFSDIKKSMEDQMNFNSGNIDLAYSTTPSVVPATSNNDMINALMNKLDQLSNQQIVLDTGVLVGQTVNKMDNALGGLASRNARSVLA